MIVVNGHALQRQANPPAPKDGGAFTMCDEWVVLGRRSPQHGRVTCAICKPRAKKKATKKRRK